MSSNLFRRPEDAHVSTRTLLKNKAVRGLRQDIGKQFGLEGDAVDALIPPKAAVEHIKFASKAAGYALKEDGVPLLIDPSGKRREKLVPTVMALWKVLTLLPCIVVHHPVSRFVLGGADLMAPGVVPLDVMPSALPSISHRDLVCVRIIGNPAPIAVASAAQSTEQVLAGGMRGRLALILQHYRDILWETSGRPVPNSGFLQARVLPVERELGIDIDDGDHDGSEEDAEPEGGNAVAAGDLEPAAAAAAAGAGTGADSETGGAEAAVEADTATELQAMMESVAEYLPRGTGEPKADADAMVEACCLQALKTYVRSRDLPILAHHFFSNMVLPSRPVGHQVNIKQSSYKKVSRLLEALEEQGVLRLENDDDVLRLVSVDRSHPLIRYHRAWPETLTHSLATQSRATEGEEASSERVRVSIHTWYRPKRAATELLRAALRLRRLRGQEMLGMRIVRLGSHARKGRGLVLTPVQEEIVDMLQDRDILLGKSELGPLLMSYASAKGLHNPDNRGELLLDATLAHFLGISSSELRAPQRVVVRHPDIRAAETAASASGSSSEVEELPEIEEAVDVVGTLGKKAAAMKFFDACENWFSMTKANGDTEVKGGRPPVLEIESASTPGKGKLQRTIIRGAHAFGLDPVVLARDAQLEFACSATTKEEAVGQQKKEPVIVIQGSVGSSLSLMMERRFGIPAACIKRVEGKGRIAGEKSQAKGKGRGKKRA